MQVEAVNVWVALSGAALSLLSIPVLRKCGFFFYYGFLPGARYRIYKSAVKIDFSGKTFTLSIKDCRSEGRDVVATQLPIDRTTELEGDLGLKLVKEYFEKSIRDAGGVLDRTKGLAVDVELETLSFALLGFGQVTVHGIAQIQVTVSGKMARFGADLSDEDDDSPVRPSSWDTRVGASRKMTSVALRKVVDEALRFLAV